MKKKALTPFGYVDEDKVIHADKQMTIKINDDNHVVSVNTKTGVIMNDYGLACADSSSNLKGDNYPGYTADADASNIKLFKTTWVVPEKPTIADSTETFFIWNGLSGGALQPVLTWGNGESAYRVNNWAYIGGNYIEGTPVYVNSGDTITGVISLQKIEGGKWHYLLSFTGYPDADFIVARDTEALGVIQCFESYTTDLDRIPSSQFCAMKDIHLEVREGSQLPATFNWQVSGGTPLPTPSGKNTVIVDRSTQNGEIDFYFH
ncbi:TPA: hypothetical protein JS309_004370 [Escherichia coli]|nr:hypothetical protein [Escherichia coli]